MTAEALTILPVQRIRRWHTYLIVWKFHRWLGLAGALFLVILSLSGSLLVIHHELDRLLEPGRPDREEESPRPLSLAAPNAIALTRPPTSSVTTTSAPRPKRTWRRPESSSSRGAMPRS